MPWYHRIATFLNYSLPEVTVQTWWGELLKSCLLMAGSRWAVYVKLGSWSMKSTSPWPTRTC